VATNGSTTYHSEPLRPARQSRERFRAKASEGVLPVSGHEVEDNYRKHDLSKVHWYDHGWKGAACPK
jgi:hypothetical protein